MNIALIGYGKMGQTIERIALQRGHTIVAKIDKDNKADLQSAAFRTADVAIEFTMPTTAFDNIKACIDAGVPVVCGTTGWLEHLDEAKKLVEEKKAALLYASNYSLGVNIFFHINRELARIMQQFDQYNVSIEEIHHIHKLDAPSGTAITLAEDAINLIDRKKKWMLGEEAPDTLTIKARREAEAPGTHIVKYKSVIDSITIEHEAHNRDGLASGAVLAAEFLQGKQGFYSMKDVLGF